MLNTDPAQCLRKKSWRTRKAARREARRLGTGARAFPCACCLGWHVDYIPTNKASAYRHPRHLSFVKRHLTEFRLLCANHHYELTLTGKIEGTDITQ